MAKKPTKEEQEKWDAFLKSNDDEKYPQAVEEVLASKEKYPSGQEFTSISFLQRKCRVGYNQAQRLIQRMVQENILEVEPAETYIRFRIIQ